MASACFGSMPASVNVRAMACVSNTTCTPSLAAYAASSATVEFEKQTFREGSYRGLFDSSGYKILLQASAGTTTWQTLVFPGPGCMSISVKNGSVTLYDLDVIDVR